MFIDRPVPQCQVEIQDFHLELIRSNYKRARLHKRSVGAQPNDVWMIGR